MSNYELEVQIASKMPISYDTLLAEIAERRNDESALGDNVWDLIAEEVLIVAGEVLRNRERNNSKIR